MVDPIVFGLIRVGAHVIERLTAGLIYDLELREWMKKHEYEDADQVLAVVPVSQFIMNFQTFGRVALSYMGLVTWWR